MATHVAFLHADPLRRILDHIKVVETRLSIRPHPARLCRAGDTLLLKQTGGEIVSACSIDDVVVYSGLVPEDIPALAEMLVPLTGAAANSAYWQRKSNARHAVILYLGQPRAVEVASADTPRSIMSGWVSNVDIPIRYRDNP